MTDEEFSEKVRRFTDLAPSKAAAARELGVSRMDLHRYIVGRSMPRSARRLSIERKVEAQDGTTRTEHALPKTIEISRLTAEKVTTLRSYLLHLVTLIDLDAAQARRD